MNVALLHYSAPPVAGGVEAVIQAQAALFARVGHSTTVIAGRGAAGALPTGVEFQLLPEMDSQHPAIVQLSAQLEAGQVPETFDELTAALEQRLAAALSGCDAAIVHNVFTKHFNLALTEALSRLFARRAVPAGLAWCHDFTWTSSNSRHKVHPGLPWDRLRARQAGLQYVVVSEARRRELAGLFGCPEAELHAIPNGVDPPELLGLSEAGWTLIERLELFTSDLVVLLPVRITQAKNIELALRVAAALKQQGVHLKMVVTGPPDPHDERSLAYFRELQDLRRELGVEAELRFVFESGPDPQEGLRIGPALIGELYRVSDLLFMPSHREGFGMPVLEAGLVGLPVLTTLVPAAEEIGGDQVTVFALSESPETVAGRVRDWMAGNAQLILRRRVRQHYTWEAIFQRALLPLLGVHDGA